MKKLPLRYLAPILLIFATSILHTGCAMCCGTYDYAYAGHGGTWERSDLNHGRVGSPFSDPNSMGRIPDSTEVNEEELDNGNPIEDSQLESIE